MNTYFHNALTRTRHEYEGYDYETMLFHVRCGLAKVRRLKRQEILAACESVAATEDTLAYDTMRHRGRGHVVAQVNFDELQALYESQPEEIVVYPTPIFELSYEQWQAWDPIG